MTTADRQHDEHADAEVASDSETDEHPHAPWHFKLMLVGTAGYLVYRIIWFGFWLSGHAWHG
jgi:hypothetical protein